MIDFRERINDPHSALSVAIDSALASVWTALPGEVQSFDPVAVTVTVQAAIQGIVTQEDGSTAAVNLPLLLDIPVVFPRGGGCSLTFPIKPGDECLVVFASRCIDAWWQSGGTANIPIESRMHDLSDAFALVGPMSQARKIAGISTSAVQLRSDDGAAFVELDPENHAINARTPGDLSAQAGRSISLTAPTITLNGNVQINGSTNSTGEITSNGKSLSTHTHGGVQSGGSSTSGPT